MKHFTHYPITEVLTKALNHMEQFRIWTDEEREHSLQASLMQLPEIKDIWVFGYASLIWRPEFTFVEERIACVQGYSRALCIWSSVNRGTPEQPGLVFGLTDGGSCQGKVFRLPNTDVMAQLRALWKREMVSSCYIPEWLDCKTDQGTVKALAFVMDRNDHSYVDNLTQEETIDIVLQAHGHYGSCTDYVLETDRSLKQAKIKDETLSMLAKKIELRMLASKKHTA